MTARCREKRFVRRNDSLKSFMDRHAGAPVEAGDAYDDGPWDYDEDFARRASENNPGAAALTTAAGLATGDTELAKVGGKNLGTHLALGALGPGAKKTRDALGKTAKGGKTTGFFSKIVDGVSDVFNRLRGKKKANSTAQTNAPRRFWTKSKTFNGSKVYQRDDLIDPKLVDDFGRTNFERMQKGLAPLGPDGKPINLHQLIQTQDSAIAEVTQTFHQRHSRVLHINQPPKDFPSGIDRNAFEAWNRRYWMDRANDF